MKGSEKSNTRRIPLHRSIRVKFLLSYLLIIGAVLIVLNTYPVFTAQSSVFSLKKYSVLNQASLISSALSSKSGVSSESALQTISLIDTSGISRLIVTDSTGLILYDSVSEPGPSYALLPEVIEALNGNDAFTSDYTKEAFRSRAAVPITYRGQLNGCVYLYEYDSQQAALIDGLQQNLWKLSVVFLILATIVSLILTTSLTRRTALLLQGIQNVGSGAEPVKVDMKGQDEISAIADEFNALTDRLAENETVRRRFVSDASHELKTPLASIKLMTDTILQTESIDDETMRDFVGDIGEEADRLTRITLKLLTLTRLDAKVQSVSEKVPVRGVVERVIHMLEPLASGRGITFTADCPTDGYISANPDDIYQIIFNLAENAVKYNRTNGSVFLKMRETDSSVVLDVEDTGIGIKEEDIPLVFDRFYRVDKARSRAAGGAGLGLSIVRDMLRKYGGEITAAPRAEGGSRFTAVFPKGTVETE